MSQRSIPKQIDDVEDDLRGHVTELNLPDSAVHQAKQIYKLSYQNDLYRGRPLNSILGASLYISSLLVEDPRTPSIISSSFDIEEEDLFDTYRHFKKNLDIPVPIAEPTAYLGEIQEELDLSNEIVNRAEEIIEIARENDYVSGKSSTGVAAASVYIAANEYSENVTQSELSEAVGVTTVTIRNRYKEQKEFLESDD